MGNNFDYDRYDENGIQIDSYDDSKMREKLIDALHQIDNDIYISNPDDKGIDLLLKNNPDLGAEGENARWDGDRWENVSQRDLFKLGVNTINLQHRKWHYWNLQNLTNKSYYYWVGKVDKGYLGNIYIRINKQEDQICVVRAESILTPEKRIMVYDKMVSNGTKLEDWICIPQEYVETYNKQPDGRWEQDGKYWGPSQEEILKEKEEYRIKRLKEFKDKK